MAFRDFVDSDGLEWQAFDVIPRTTERRTAERRSGETRAVEEGAETERRESDRRFVGTGRATLTSTVRSGWLVFERGAERRRLSPIPENWQRLTDSELDAYLRVARPVDQKKSAAG